MDNFSLVSSFTSAFLNGLRFVTIMLVLLQLELISSLISFNFHFSLTFSFYIKRVMQVVI